MIRFGHAKFLAHRSLKGEPVPVFKARADNRLVLDHEDRILRAQTFRPKLAKGGGR